MSFEDEVLRLTKQKEGLKTQREALNKKLEELEDTLEEVEDKEQEIQQTLNNLHKKNKEEGFEVWKSQQTEEVLKKAPMEFMLTEEQMLKVRYLKDLYGNVYNGAVGGGTTYAFTPTGIGVILTVTINGKEFDLTEDF